MLIERAGGRERAVLFVFGTVVVANVLTVAIDRNLLGSWLWASIPTHSAMESAGSVVAGFVAILLIELERRDAGTSYNIPIALALAGMGVLDGVHALAELGQSFVNLHTAATLVGGVLFATVLLPERLVRRVRPRHVAASACVSLVIGLVLVVDSSPAVNDDSGFSLLQQLTNAVGGLLFIAAGAKLSWSYRRTGMIDDLFFATLCWLFGAAAVTFQVSHLWDFTWWGWHLMRLGAYAVAAGFAVRNLETAATSERSVREALQAEVTARQQAEGELAATMADLRSTQDLAVRMEKLSTIGSLVGGVAHEINNPLMGLSNYVSYTRNKLDPGRPRDMLDSATQQIDRIDRIVKNLLLYSREKSQTLEGGVAVTLTLDRVLGVIEPRLKEVSATIEREIPSDLPGLDLPTDSLEQILTNLILNAADVVPDDHTGVIVISAVRRDDQVDISVDDNGPGVDDAIRFKVFDPFFTTKDPEKGTGLGLSICSRLANEANALLRVEESTTHGGARFVLTCRIASERENA